LKILLDHNAPHGLRHALTDHDVQTAEYQGWETLRNGDLIRNAAQDGYDLLITCDQSIRFQQNLIRQPITVLTITTNDWNTIRTNLSLVRSAIDMAQQGENNLLRLGPPP
jgi:predicted nuclease of predicted toxin-antitoxin system